MKSEANRLQLLEYLELLLQQKTLFLGVFLLSFVLSYAAIYFLIEEQFEATALIIPREDDASGLLGGLLRSTKGLPLGIGMKSSNSEMDMYMTIIYSRTMMEDLIQRFGLLEVYGLDTSDIAHMEEAIKRLRKEVITKETDESAFLVTVRAGTRERSAEMTNFIIQKMNEKIINLKLSRSVENRVFLGKRVNEIDLQLKQAEDSLRAFQERTGLLDAKTQLQGILSAYTSLETELIAKRFQQGILERLYDKESPQVMEVKMRIQEYEKQMTQLRSRRDPGSPLLPLESLPRTTAEFLRRYRDVQIKSLLMEYVMPLYEQAKIEEKKDYPVLQVIDYAVPPAKKSYPPRTIFSLVGAISVLLLVFTYMVVREAFHNTTDPRVRSLLKEARSWNWKLRDS